MYSSPGGLFSLMGVVSGWVPERDKERNSQADNTDFGDLLVYSGKVA